MALSVKCIKHFNRLIEIEINIAPFIRDFFFRAASTNHFIVTRALLPCDLL